MIESEVNLPANQWVKVLNVLSSHSSHLQPLQMSIDEDGERFPINIEELSEVDEFNGFFWSETCGYEVSLGKEIITVFSFSEESIGIKLLMERFCNLDIEFGYAADSAERKHRNKVVQRKSYGIHEAWVGRDYRQYLPGLYWITIMPISMVSRVGVSLDELRRLSFSLEVINNSNLMVMLYEDPARWVEHSEIVESLSEECDGIFSKSKVEMSSLALEDFFSVSEEFAKYP